MTYDPSKHHRRSIRHPDHDYRAPGAYFVTVCTKWRECALEDPALAAICREVWYALPQWFPTIALDEFVVMPNHVHFILVMYDSCKGDSRIPLTIKRKPLGRLVGAFKTVSTKKINQLHNSVNHSITQCEQGINTS